MMKFGIAVICVLFGTGCRDEMRALRFFAEPDALRQGVQCVQLPTAQEQAAVADVSPVSDTSFAALFPDERRLVIFNELLRPIHNLDFDRDGPRGVMRPVSVAVTDSLIYVADDARSQIRIFDSAGSDRGTIRLPFVPRRLRVSHGRLVVSPLIAGTSPAHLLFGVRDGSVTPLGGPIARYDDIGVNTLANMVAIAAFPTRVVVLHEPVVPFGYVIRSPGAASSVERFALPLPASERGRVGRLPRAPLSEKNVNELSVAAFAAAEMQSTGGVLYVTRAGDGKLRGYRKLLVQLDSAMFFQRAYTINANPHHMVYLAGRKILITVDRESEWAACRLPL